MLLFSLSGVLYSLGKERNPLKFFNTAPANFSFMLNILLCLCQEEDQQPLTVHHYQYTEWPDRGVPSSPASLLHLLHHIHTAHPLPSSQEQHPQPLLAHCSAGVGRTGTLLAVDRLLRQVACGAHTVNVLQTVRELRSCRPGMVLNDVRVNSYSISH